MPSKKQRRRNEKARRHEYEYVYVDEEGHELPVEEGEKPQNQKAESPGRGAARAKGRAGRPVKPPSWQRAATRGPLFAVLLFVVTGLGKHPTPLRSRIFFAVVYALLFIPFLYFLDSAMYRAYRRRIGDPLPPSRRRRREP